MKEKFKAFNRLLSASEQKSLWDKAIVILDTNVLLNLYCYQEQTSKDFISILEKFPEKFWIPFHVGLEYHRNRTKIIVEQKKLFNTIATIVNDAFPKAIDNLEQKNAKFRHSTINIPILLERINAIKSEFLEELSTLQECHFDPEKEDFVLNTINTIFTKNIGDAPIQGDITEWNKEAADRFEKKIPPGYLDDPKDNSIFSFQDVTYHKKYGDYYIWKQCIEHVKETKNKYVIFITDDAKEDWWEQSVVPRYELIEEIQKEGEVIQFHMYNSEKFLSFAQQELLLPISEESLSDIKDNSIKNNFYHPLLKTKHQAELEFFADNYATALQSYQSTQNNQNYMIAEKIVQLRDQLNQLKLENKVALSVLKSHNLNESDMDLSKIEVLNMKINHNQIEISFLEKNIQELISELVKQS